MALEPRLIGKLVGAILFPDHARLDSAAMTANAAAAARRLGASIREGEEDIANGDLLDSDEAEKYLEELLSNESPVVTPSRSEAR